MGWIVSTQKDVLKVPGNVTFVENKAFANVIKLRKFLLDLGKY